MRLHLKTMFVLIPAMAVVLLMAGIYMYADLNKVVKEEIDEAMWEEMKEHEEYLETLENPESAFIPGLIITPLQENINEPQYYFSDTLIEEADEEGEYEEYRFLSYKHRFKAKSYELLLIGAGIDSEDLTESLMMNFSIVFGLLACMMILLQFTIVKKLWRPFHDTLHAIGNFDITGKNKTRFPDSTTFEFRELKSYLEALTEKVSTDYQNLKSFTENAAHELQTPLAIVQSKLENIIQSQNLPEKEIENAAEALRVSKRLSKLTSSLLLLSKIENKQFEERQKVNLAELSQKIATEQDELAKLKSVSVDLQVAIPFEHNIHPDLAEILIRNLLINALKHSEKGARMEIESNNSGLSIRNPGMKELDRDKIFRRFAKHAAGPENTGLGLAIAREICLANKLQLTYHWSNGQHEFRISP